MTTHHKFGKLLRSYRLSSRDIEQQNRQLTQARLAALSSREEKVGTIPGTQVSQWETGERGAPRRPILLGLIKVLYTCGGITNLDEASEFIKAAGASILQPEEISWLGFTIDSTVGSNQMKRDETTYGVTNINVGTSQDHSIVTGRIGVINWNKEHLLDKYLRGVERLHPRLKAKDREAYLLALPLLSALMGNIERAKREDDSAELVQEREAIVNKLDRLCMQSIDEPFQTLCY